MTRKPACQGFLGVIGPVSARPRGVPGRRLRRVQPCKIISDGEVSSPCPAGVSGQYGTREPGRHEMLLEGMTGRPSPERILCLGKAAHRSGGGRGFALAGRSGAALRDRSPPSGSPGFRWPVGRPPLPHAREPAAHPRRRTMASEHARPPAGVRFWGRLGAPRPPSRAVDARDEGGGDAGAVGARRAHRGSERGEAPPLRSERRGSAPDGRTVARDDGDLVRRGWRDRRLVSSGPTTVMAEPELGGGGGETLRSRAAVASARGGSLAKPRGDRVLRDLRWRRAPPGCGSLAPGDGFRCHRDGLRRRRARAFRRQADGGHGRRGAAPGPRLRGDGRSRAWRSPGAQGREVAARISPPRWPARSGIGSDLAMGVLVRSPRTAWTVARAAVPGPTMPTCPSARELSAAIATFDTGALWEEERHARAEEGDGEQPARPLGSGGVAMNPTGIDTVRRPIHPRALLRRPLRVLRFLPAREPGWCARRATRTSSSPKP